MATIHPLGKPTVADEVQADVVATLEKALSLARNGEIRGCIVIFDHVADGWQWEASKVTVFSEAIGRLEIIKHEWIGRYLIYNVR